MTNLEQGTPLQRFIRARATPAPRVPITARLSTPGTVVLPPTSRAVAQAEQAISRIGGWERRMIHRVVRPTRRIFMEVY